MGVEFTLTGNAFTVERWNELFEKWGERQKIPIYQEHGFSTDGEAPSAFILADGSIRGVVFSYDKETGEVTLRYNVLASRLDWAIGFSLMAIALKNGGGTLTRETGDIYGAEMLTAKHAHKECSINFCACARMVLGTIKKKGEMNLPISNFDLPITEIDVSGCTPEAMPSIEKALALRVKKYASAYPAMTMLLNSGQRLGSWALIPTIVGEVDAVGIDYNEITVPLDRVKAILGFRAERLGPSATYLPELDLEFDKEILEQLSKENIGNDPSPKDGDGDGDDEGEDTDADEQAQIIIVCTKAIIINMMKGRDPKIIQKRMRKQGIEDELFESLLVFVARSMQSLVQEEKNVDQVVADLVEDGFPENFAMAIMVGINEGIKEYGEKNK